ncbi:MAG: UDP-N-acetylmuramoyl-L-alanyl-D-glutamate--2,6-diaminopimelate ligase [Simkaniaceae bacterium]|nr:UDP-N-acetylmuramoyl-L-alanyl-D-glutamate--2,6-diaminopimelate ligase [Candidatus Sacchlamyda saccharinae]
MRLRHLIQQIEGLEVKGSKEIEITGITAHSKSVAPNNLFIAKKGTIHDGAQFIPDAVAAGASAILTDMYDPFLNVTQLIHPNISVIEAKLAARYYQNPSEQLKVIGVTGTNGKTTVGYLIKHLFDKTGVSAGLIGTVEWIIGNHRFPNSMTTLDVLSTQKLLRDMVIEKSQAAILEVSSHGLDQNRVAEVDFDIAIFTNLSAEHLDYHKDMESYRAAKAKLFSHLSSDKWAILNADENPFQTKAKIFSYGIENEADLRATNIKLSEKKTQFTLVYQGVEYKAESQLIGTFNVYNYLAALSAGICYGLSIKSCIQALKNFKSTPGRLQKVAEGVFVDYAHTEDALKNVLTTLRKLTGGRLITVFGCGGDRDFEKRPKMGKVATSFSDLTVITSDNPRSEDPQKIIDEILQGCIGPVHIHLDRFDAIRFALTQKKPGDIVLIAGKGHEKKQIFAHTVHPFDDANIAKDLCEASCEN